MEVPRGRVRGPAPRSVIGQDGVGFNGKRMRGGCAHLVVPCVGRVRAPVPLATKNKNYILLVPRERGPFQNLEAPKGVMERANLEPRPAPLLGIAYLYCRSQIDHCASSLRKHPLDAPTLEHPSRLQTCQVKFPYERV